MSHSKVQNPQFKIGCQGWNYPDWVTKAGGESVFYPRGTKVAELLEFYARVFETVEVDSSFYAIPPAATLEGWSQKTPENFTFALKMPREITHEKFLHSDSYSILEEFCERIQILGKKLGPVLIQLPPNLEASKENAQNLRKFLTQLPKQIRFAIEFRNRQWMVEWTFQELKKNSVAICLVEGEWIPRDLMFQSIEKTRADFLYVRFMGDRDLESFDQVVRPRDSNLQLWKDEIIKLKTTNNFIYFSNFYEGYAPASSNHLKSLLGQTVIEPGLLETQKSLF